jgi:hypothetical protein
MGLGSLAGAKDGVTVFTIKAKFASPTAFLRTSTGKICRSGNFFSSVSGLSGGVLSVELDPAIGISIAAANSSVKPARDSNAVGSCPSGIRGEGAAEVGLETKMAMI